MATVAARQLQPGRVPQPRRSLELIEGTGGRPHGKRSKYVREECRCAGCTAANTSAERARRRRATSAYAPAGPIREHLRWLAEQGVGARSIEHASGVPRSIVRDVRSGKQRRLRPDTGRRLLEVGSGDRAGGVLVDAAPARRLVDELVKAGHTRAAIARALGSSAARPALQLRGGRVTVAKVRAIEALARREGIA